MKESKFSGAAIDSFTVASHTNAPASDLARIEIQPVLREFQQTPYGRDQHLWVGDSLIGYQGSVVQISAQHHGWTVAIILKEFRHTMAQTHDAAWTLSASLPNGTSD